jgi:hypothetical protein
MTKKIVASDPLKKMSLAVNEQGIVYGESAAFGMGEEHPYSFDQIDAIVRSSGVPAALSIQIGHTIHSIPIKKDDEGHRAVIDQIVAGALRSRG